MPTVSAGVRKLPHFTPRCPSIRCQTTEAKIEAEATEPAGRIAMLIRKLVAELLGTAILVVFAVGTATLAFGFQLQGGSTAAGVVMTSLAFGLVLIALVYAIGPV